MAPNPVATRESFNKQTLPSSEQLLDISVRLGHYYICVEQSRVGSERIGKGAPGPQSAGWGLGDQSLPALTRRLRSCDGGEGGGGGGGGGGHAEW